MTNQAENHDCCGRAIAAPAACPACSRPGRPVKSVTLDHHLAPALRARLGSPAGFCPNPACGVVYFSGHKTILKGETLQPVTCKDPGDDVHVCYCFNIRRSDIRRDLAARGSTDVINRIRSGIAAGGCSCEKLNPGGACCLGDVVAEIQKIKVEKAHGGQ